MNDFEKLKKELSTIIDTKNQLETEKKELEISKQSLEIDLKEKNKKIESFTSKGLKQDTTSKKLDEEIQLKIQLEKEKKVNYNLI